MNKTLYIIIITIFILTTFCIFTLFYLKQGSSLSVVENITDINEAYNVKTCALKFYMYCKDYRISAPSSIYDLLDKEYTKKYRIDKNNVKENIEIINSDTYRINKVLKIQQKNNLSLYLVKGNELYRNKDEIKELNFLVKIDKTKNTFSVYLNNYIDEKKYDNIKLGDCISIKLSSINKNYNNTFDDANKNMYNNVKDVFSDYRQLCIFYERYSFEVLSEESKREQFQSYEAYDKFILSRYKDIVMSDMLKYETDINDDKIIYTCHDNYGKKYVFNIKSYITYDVTIENN